VQQGATNKKIAADAYAAIDDRSIGYVDLHFGSGQSCCAAAAIVAGDL
jgi:hypothetical protein